MSKYEYTQDYAKYYLSVVHSNEMSVNEEDVLNWLREFKNIDTNADDPLVKHIVQFAPDYYEELLAQDDEL